MVDEQRAQIGIPSELAPEEVRLLDWLYRTTRGDGPRGIYYSEVHEADVAARSASMVA
jgi:hypothetical protein